MEIVRNFFITFALFMVVDLIWLGLVAKKLYRNQIGFLMADRTNWVAAILFYIFYIVGISFFVIYPALAKASWQYALLVGFLFGAVTYMTYDLTNLATLKGWPMLLTVVDILWGTVLGGVVSFLSFVVIRML